MEFKVGDRVKVVRGDCFDSRVLGKVGSVKECIGKNSIAVVFDDNVNGHDLGGICKFGYGWLCSPKNLERIANNKDKIVITSDGKRVTAKLYNGKELVRSSEAKCCPDDEFNFEFGVTLAMDRLFGREPDKVKPKELLRNGIFGKNKSYGWFIVVNDKLIFFDGGHSNIECYNDDLTEKCHPRSDYIEVLVDAPNLNSAEISVENNRPNVIWKR